MMTIMQRRKEIRILLVEDNPGDVRLFQEALKGCTFPYKIRVARDGEDASNILFEKRGEDEPLPDLIVLDLNLPKVHGHEILVQLKSDPELRSIPVVIFSCSDDQADIRQSYEHHASCYLVKPSNLFDYLKLVQACGEFWVVQTFAPRIIDAASGPPSIS
jgi:chemotaxis family two-component system response regulator Rcp1